MIFAANLKCNHTRASFQGYASEIDEFLKKENANAQKLGAKDENSQNEILVFPPSTAFLKGEFAFTQGAQNFYPAAEGAFTGEIGSEHLAEFGIECVLLGHSERRVLLNESDDLVQKKFDFAKANAYKIVLCVGENLDTKNAGKTKEFLSKQLVKLDLSYDKLIIAYEPIYSIGTGVSANLHDIAEILGFLSEKSGAKCLYGGSVNESNVREILNLGHCSGVLIGSAALEAKKFINLINLIKKG